MTAPARPDETTVPVADLSAGDVIRLPDWTHPAVVEAISDGADGHRTLDATFLTFGTSPGRLVLTSRATVARLDVTVWRLAYTNVTAGPAAAWVRGRRVIVPAGGRVAVVDTDHRAEFDVATWRLERQSVRPDLLERPGWQTLRPAARPEVARSLTG